VCEREERREQQSDLGDEVNFGRFEGVFSRELEIEFELSSLVRRALGSLNINIKSLNADIHSVLKCIYELLSSIVRNALESSTKYMSVKSFNICTRGVLKCMYETPSYDVPSGP